jgi:2'-5' RNA ligase
MSEQTHRLFVAIDLPNAIKDHLAPLLKGISGAKWVSRPQLHLTLRFIGEVETPRFQAIARALESVQSSSFETRLNGVGRFPPKGPPRVLWVGMDEHPTMMDLQQQIEKTLVQLDLAPEDRPFSAHITLARLKTPPPRDVTDGYLAKHSSFQTPTFPVSQFVLYSSVLSRQGPSYHVEQTYRLSGNS